MGNYEQMRYRYGYWYGYGYARAIVNMARERTNFRDSEASFFVVVLHEIGGSPQKAVERIFELALERYQELLQVARAPRILPQAYVSYESDFIPELGLSAERAKQILYGGHVHRNDSRIAVGTVRGQVTEVRAQVHNNVFVGP